MNRSQPGRNRRQFLHQLFLPAIGLVASARETATQAATRAQSFNVYQFGARGNGTTLDTASLQKAIVACARNGGGTVLFPPGRYLSGTLFLKSRVTLHFEAGAVLLGSTRLEDYPPTVASIRSYTDNYTERSLIFGEHLDQIALEGNGVIDGQGAAFKGGYKVRPYLIRLIDCQGVSVRELTLKNSAMWVQHYLACDGVHIDGITVLSKCNANNDGIDIDGCRRVRIANCDIQSGDDAIVLKSTLERPCRHVVITNCLLSSDCNAFKLGTESNGGFEDVVLSNCSIYNTRLAGIALEMVDGGSLDGVNISNITMRRVNGPIFIRLGNRARPFQEGMARPGMGTLRNVSISYIQASEADRTGCSITGLPDRPVENITLSHIRLGFAGGGSREHARRPVPEKPEAYPEYSMFGALPAYGFYCRHVRNLAFDHVGVDVAIPDNRPALVCDDAAMLELEGWAAAKEAADGPIIHLQNVSDSHIAGCRGSVKAGSFFSVEGENSRGIEIVANQSIHAPNVLEIGQDVPRGAVQVVGLR